MDWRTAYGANYNPTSHPGILVDRNRSSFKCDRPLYVCAYCGREARQIRADDGEFISRRCSNEACYTLACMHRGEWVH